MDDAKDAIRRRLAEVKTFLARESPPRLSESDTKANFIEPIIAALGWEGIGVVTREYYVRNSQEFIDYVMAGPTGPLLAIEAKPLQTDLTDKHAAQLIQYCAVEGIEWAALTNGRELQFFNSFLKPDLAAKRVLRLDLLAFNNDHEFEALFGQIWQLSRESMTTPSGVRTWLNQRRLDTALRAILLDASSPTMRQLRKALADAEISATTQDLAQWFRHHLGAPVTALPVPPRQGLVRKDDRPQGAVERPVVKGRQPPPSEFVSRADDPVNASMSASAVDANALLSALRTAVDHRFPETTWRTTKTYTAAKSEGQTYLAAMLQPGRLLVGLSLPPQASADRLTDDAGQFYLGLISKTALIAEEADMDEELFNLIERARSYAVSERRQKAYYGVALRDLIEAGYLSAGTPLVLIGPGHREFARARLTGNGEIEWDGNAYRSPSDGSFARLFGRATLNGWHQWYAVLPEGRESLADVRGRFLEATKIGETAEQTATEQQRVSL